MRIRFDEQLEQLNEEMINMGNMIEASIGDAVKALMKQDEELAKKTMAGDEKIDRTERKIEDLCLRLLLQQQPVARDLRNISSALKMVTDMERIGDHAVNLAEYGDDMRKWEIDFSDTVKEELNEMKAQCIAALDNLKEVTSENVERILSQAVIIEQKTDDMRDKYFKKQMQRLKKGKCKPQSGIVFSEILTDFERMGDHALNIAQQYREME